MHVTSELFGLPIVKDVMAITAWEPPQRMDVEHRGQFHGTGSFLLERRHDGTTFIWIEDFAPPLGSSARLSFAVVIRPHLRRVFARSLENVRQMADGECTRCRGRLARVAPTRAA